MSLKEGVELNITQCRWVRGYVLEISFSDGFSRQLDFEPFLSQAAQPDIRKYLEPDLFKGFLLRYGNLVWGDYELCFPLGDLYSGNLVADGALGGMVAEDVSDYKTRSG